MNEKLRESTNLCVKMINSKRQVKEKRGHVHGMCSRLPLDVNVMLDLSIIQIFAFLIRFSVKLLPQL